MFTGIVTDVGACARRTRYQPRIAVSRSRRHSTSPPSISGLGEPCRLLPHGRGKGRDWFAVEVSGETLSHSTLDNWKEGRRVNLERSARVGDELGGHIVSGHVDGVGEIVSVESEGGSHRVRVRVPRPLHRFIAPKARSPSRASR
jgi:riboflavin synthase